jgi:23S rRNA pseudouridine955/2504/2580 synthase/23S rRNA pseudouridine1911/1915/1917 synthase
MKISATIIFENDDFIVVNKPAGLLSIPDREGKEVSLKKLLEEKYGSIYTVHRLDRQTSGLIVFAKHELAHKHLSMQFENRRAQKIYLGLVLGSFIDKKGKIELPIAEHPVKKGMMTIHKNGKESVTEYAVIEEWGMYSWLQFRIHTGRTHQIRVHMKDSGHPLVCDELYGDGKPVFISSIKHKFKLSKKEEEERPILNRLALHSYQLTFTNLNGEQQQFEAPLPKDLKATLQQLEKWIK